MITRRALMGSAVALAGSIRRAAADPIAYRDYSRCLPDYLTALATDAYRRRSEKIAKLTTAAAIREYQWWARTTFLKLAGALPERTPLNIRTVGAFERERYRVEKLVYESRPGLMVSANLYLPKSGGTHPGVLFQMGHGTDGKGYALYQRCCQGLVQLGYVVLAFDPMGQGERTNFPREGGWLTRLSSADEEHTVPGRQMLLTGETATGFQLWDAMRSLDVLASHPSVDARRLASTGQSGGGTLTMLLAAADERLSAAAVSCGNTENFATQPFLAPGSTDDAEQDLVGSGPPAFDRWDMLWPLAPKPLLVTTSARDFFGTYSPSYERSGREEFARLARAYAALDAAGKLSHVETPLPHGLSYSLRVAIYDWFERHLKQSGREITEEPPTAPEPEETLWCGRTGNVVRDFGSKPVTALIRERAQSIRTPDGPAELKKLLNVQAPPAASSLVTKGKTSYGNCDIAAVEVASAPGVWLPVWLFLPRTDWKKLLLILDPSGRNTQWHEDELYPRLAGAGIAVCAADVRGIGDLQPGFSAGAAAYTREHQNEENYAWASLILGHSLLGQRVTDIVAMVRALASAYAREEIVVAARDRMTVPALCAAALEPRIARVYLARHLASWRSVAESEQYSQPLANFVPDILRHTDLPQIARSIAPRPVTVAGTIGANGKLLGQEEPAWNFDALSRL
jgi:cephalosporin-C deacetylase-like acetyl esterase